VKSGNLTGLLITGLTPRGAELIENYVKRSGDVQTAALLGVMALPRGFPDGRGLRWLDSYRDLMDSWCMHIQAIISCSHLSECFLPASNLCGVAKTHLTRALPSFLLNRICSDASLMLL
jgi:hypothetical protein